MLNFTSYGLKALSIEDFRPFSFYASLVPKNIDLRGTLAKFLTLILIYG